METLLLTFLLILQKLILFVFRIIYRTMYPCLPCLSKFQKSVNSCMLCTALPCLRLRKGGREDMFYDVFMFILS